MIALDVGSSTGGFTQCLLMHGVKRVYAVDVGRGQMDPKLRYDPRVVLYEETDARELTEEHIPQSVDLITVDVSFIPIYKEYWCNIFTRFEYFKPKIHILYG